MTNRFLRHFNFISFTEMSDTSVTRIFTTILSAFFKKYFTDAVQVRLRGGGRATNAVGGVSVWGLHVRCKPVHTLCQLHEGVSILGGRKRGTVGPCAMAMEGHCLCEPHPTLPHTCSHIPPCRP